MNIHKCNEAARWKAEVLQMMWAGAKDHVAGARARARQRTLPPWDAICPGCHPLWRCHPFRCHQWPLDAINNHQMPPLWDVIFPVYLPLWRCHPLWMPLPAIRCHFHGMMSALDATPFDATPMGHWSHEHPCPAEFVAQHRGVPCHVQVLGAGGSPQGPPFPGRSRVPQVGSGKGHAGFQAGPGRAPVASCCSQPGCKCLQIPLTSLPPSPVGG